MRIGKQLVLFALCCCFSVHETRVLGSPAPAEESKSVLDGIYDNQSSIRFSHWSNRSHRMDQLETQFDYAVCNFSPRDPLHFKWDKPSFGTGPLSPLPIGKCATLAITGDGVITDHDAPILFTQRGERKAASVFLPKEAQSFTSHTLFKTFTNTIGSSSFVDFEIRCNSERNSSKAFCYLHWSQGVHGVGIALPPSAVFRENPYKTDRIRGADLLRESRNYGFIDEQLENSEFVVWSIDDYRTSSLRVEYELRYSNSGGPVLLFDVDRKLLGYFSYLAPRDSVQK